MQFAGIYETSAVSTRDTDQGSLHGCPGVVSVGVLTSELMNLVSFVLWAEMFPCRSLWAPESWFTDKVWATPWNGRRRWPEPRRDPPALSSPRRVLAA